MAIKCKYCGRDYDTTLFEFDRTINCVCGKIVAFKHERMRDEGILEKDEEEDNGDKEE